MRAVAERITPRASWSKRLLKAGLYACLVLTMTFGFLLGLFVFKYDRIVRARPSLQTKVQPKDLGRWVDPFVGTGGFPWVCGNNSPAAMVPFGMVRLGPETTSILIGKRALNTSGYYYGDERLRGFSHTRLDGTGATDGGHFLVMPSREPAVRSAQRKGRTTLFSHSQEAAFPGYYAVELPQLDVLVELTATPHVGVHCYTFTGSRAAHLLIDVSNALGGHRSTDGKVRVLPGAKEVEGSVRTYGTFAARYGGLKVYFVARFDQPFASFGTWQDETFRANRSDAEADAVGADLEFGSGDGPQVVTLRLAISHVSIENARANLESEATGSFDLLAAQAQQKWEERLSLVRVEGGSDSQKRIFYTALYRVFQMPTVFNDANGEYLGFDRKVHPAAGFQYYTDLSLWDTFRTVHPLYTLLAPKDQRDMMVSLTKMLEQGGWLPRWPAGHGYSNSMLGTPADIVIAESYLKGIRDFDVQAAYRSMRLTALAPVPNGSAFSGRAGIQNYVRYGYCPCKLTQESVSRTLEYGWSDKSVSLLAAALGDTNDAELFQKHSEFYRNLWNPQTQYFQPRDVQGKFFEPFKPLLLTYLDRKGKFTKDYVEGSALQWRWGAPYDAEGMIALFKSRDFFVEELNRFFARSNPTMGAWNPGPYYWHGNEPDIHAAYLFNEAGRPDLTQKWVRWILDHKYADSYKGLDGNDDAGTLSAWYVLSALGLYPVAGSDKYELGAPLFKRAEVDLGGHLLTIISDNYAPDHAYVDKVWIDDTRLNRFWIRHWELEQAKTLRFKMCASPVIGGTQ